MKRYFKSLFGLLATITANRDGSFHLVVRNTMGCILRNKTYATERGARIAMGRSGVRWRETR